VLHFSGSGRKIAGACSPPRVDGAARRGSTAMCEARRPRAPHPRRLAMRPVPQCRTASVEFRHLLVAIGTPSLELERQRHLCRRRCPGAVLQRELWRIQSHRQVSRPLAEEGGQSAYLSPPGSLLDTKLKCTVRVAFCWTRSPMGNRFSGFTAWNPTASYMVSDQNALAGGRSPLSPVLYEV
jgi:hypothetical protein